MIPQSRYVFNKTKYRTHALKVEGEDLIAKKRAKKYSLPLVWNIVTNTLLNTTNIIKIFLDLYPEVGYDLERFK